MRRDAAQLILRLPEKARRVTRAGAFMTKIFYPAFCAAREGSGKSGKRVSASFLFSSTAMVALLAASASALAQTPPTPDPKQYGLTLIGAPIAWAAGYTGAGVTIAVGDTGVTNNQDPLGFTGAGKIDSRSKNFVLPYPGAKYDPKQITDLGSHGTHVSGIALASATSDTPGVAYDANLVMLRVLASSTACGSKVRTCKRPASATPTAASLNYFASLANVNIYNASFGISPSAGNHGSRDVAQLYDPRRAMRKPR